MNTQPPTSRLLLSSLFGLVKGAIKNYQFPDPSGKWQDCRVFLHNLPEEQEADTWPFVVVRWVSGNISDEPQSATITDTVNLYLGVYSPRSPAEAGLLLAELLDCLRREIWKTRVLNDRFQQVEPLEASSPEPERQIHKFHLATIRTVWEYLWPSREQMELTQLLNKERI